MKLSLKCRNYFKAFMLPAVISLGTLTSCESIFDDQGDCSVHYKVSFSYTMNMAYADAFPSQVKALTLYIVDKNGNIVLTKSAQGTALAEPDYEMDVDVLPGTYDLLVWAEGESPVADPTAYTIGGGSNPISVSQLSATLPLNGEGESLYCDRDITPLFHGLVTGVDFPDTYGKVEIGPVDLTKDTNVFQVLIQSIDGTEINPGEFAFSIEADNSALSYTNAVTSTTPFDYRPWNVTATSADFDSLQANRADSNINGILAEMTTGRLMATSSPQLVINRTTDDTDVIRIDLLKYLLMVKGEYNNKLSDQQYLDRADNYSLMFFLDSNRNWYTAGGIYINGWRIVPPQQGGIIY
ncbi:MAG: FimB/Mfa2 family fimbrial subunit [Muribaculaceae bacterium]|nr:FimB/Mfa2 family fimbrial subunit [Muribaculaceae bacterium]